MLQYIITDFQVQKFVVIICSCQEESTQTTTVFVEDTTYTGSPSRVRYLFQVVQTQTTTAYCRILPALDHHICDIFFR